MLPLFPSVQELLLRSWLFLSSDCALVTACDAGTPHPPLRGKAWQSHYFCAAHSSQVFVIVIKWNTKIPLPLKNTNLWQEHWGRSVQGSFLKELFNSNLRFSLNKAYIRQTSCNRDERERKGRLDRGRVYKQIPCCSLCPCFQSCFQSALWLSGLKQTASSLLSLGNFSHCHWG